jgi:hypothetical protein
MSEATSPPAKPAKKSFLSFLTWWRTDSAEIDKQVAQYTTLKVWQSARGISLLLCGLSIAITVLLGGFLKLSAGTIVLEAIMWGVLGLLMFRGMRWAFVAAMLLWTLEKARLLFGNAGGSSPIVQVIWWVIYMNAFMLGFRVERARRAQSEPESHASYFPMNDE